MAKLNWKIAAAGGAALGLGVGGFTLADADETSFRPVRDVDLQSARDSISSLSSPIRVTPPTTVRDASVSPVSPVAPAPAPPAPVVASADSPVPPPPPPAPAPAPVFDDSTSAGPPVQPAQGGGGDSASFSGGGGST